ncbi:integrin alpha-9-like [Lytechinus pictus]|uniref:integrin alpha-9-like n=1 Tax=Lytechinus pictus TaxID=7653 RepID=UPI0030BA1013
MGVSIAHQQGANNELTVCGHRYGNNYAIVQPNADLSDVKIDRYTQGICITLDSGLQDVYTRFNPCAEESAWRDDLVANESTRWQGWCQFGMSAAYAKDGEDSETFVAGAPGSYDWTGTIFKQQIDTDNQMDSGVLRDWNTDYSYDDFFQYVGYSTTVGYFRTNTTQQGASGAPRAGGLVGKVYIHDLQTFQVYQELQGEMMNTYFGGAVAALDINGDGFSDLLVGAPLYSVDQDEGRVYVYINSGGTNPDLVLHQTLDGTSTPGSRFGHAIVSLNDITDDLLPEIAIGAPYEGGGVVYIYQCIAGGVDEAYLQRIDGRDTDPNVQTFGSAIAGGGDIDDNFYPDLAVGAYASDSVFVYKTRPLLDLVVTLTVTPDPLDPKNPSCIDSVGTCIEISVCFTYSGPRKEALPQYIDVIFDIELDKEKTAAGFKPRFLLQNGTEMLNELSAAKQIRMNVDICFDYKAYLQSTASDFLSPVPVDLTYILRDYEHEGPPRQDRPQQFPYGIPPLMLSPQCRSITTVEDLNFVRDCGVDALCRTDLKLIANVSIEGNPTEIISGGPSRLYVNARIENDGEEAHQAVLTITHPYDMRYEGLETNELSCLDDNECDARALVLCEPTVAGVKCDLGNPMNSYIVSTLRLRFDIGGLIYDPGRIVNIVISANTSSLQTPESLADNILEVDYKLVIGADVGIFGSSTPESVYYVSNGSNYATAQAAEKSLQAAVNMSLISPTSPSFNDTHIGSPFTLSYQITNDGPGQLPFSSVVTIHIPWRMLNGDWLIFIKNINIIDRTNTGSCNGEEIIELQNRRLLERYRGTSFYRDPAPEEDISPIFDTSEGNQQLGCTQAKCVALTCYVNQMQARQVVEVRIDAIPWEHTIITRRLGYVEILTEAEFVAQSPSGSFGQGEDANPDRIQLPIKLYTEMKGAGELPIWIIIVSILAGLILLIVLILLLWKCGFFKRKTRKDWEEEADGAAPMPIKPPVDPTGELDGSDLPMMKGLAAKE